MSRQWLRIMGGRHEPLWIKQGGHQLAYESVDG